MDPHNYGEPPRAEGFDNADLDACSHGMLFSRDSPRLPTSPLLAFDRVEQISPAHGDFGRGFAIASALTNKFGWLFACHFPDDPVLPGAILLDGVLQLAGFFGAYIGMKGKGRAGRLGNIRFVRPVVPDQTLLSYRIDVRKVLHRSATIIAAGVVTIDGQVSVEVKDLAITFVNSHRHQNRCADIGEDAIGSGRGPVKVLESRNNDVVSGSPAN